MSMIGYIRHIALGKMTELSERSMMLAWHENV